MAERCKSCDHDTQAHAADGSGCLYQVDQYRLGRDGMCPCTFDAYRKPICKASEGCTGIDCGLVAAHDGDHEGTHTPRANHDPVGYPLFVRWPYTDYDHKSGIRPARANTEETP